MHLNPHRHSPNLQHLLSLGLRMSRRLHLLPPHKNKHLLVHLLNPHITLLKLAEVAVAVA
jgi:hypothetical protein